MDLVLLIYTFFFSLSKAIRSSQIRRNSLMTINIELLPYLRYSHSVCVCVCTPIERSQKSRKFFYRMPFFLSQLFAVTLEKKKQEVSCCLGIFGREYLDRKNSKTITQTSKRKGYKYPVIYNSFVSFSMLCFLSPFCSSVALRLLDLC